MKHSVLNCVQNLFQKRRRNLKFSFLSFSFSFLTHSVSLFSDSSVSIRHGPLLCYETVLCLLTQNQNSLLCFAVNKSLTKGDGRCTIRAGKWLQQVSSLKQSNSSRQKKRLYGKETFLLLIISRDFCNSSYS